jgi:folate-binding protein YgfZ
MVDRIACARDGALVVPWADRGTLTVTGPDRVSWLSGLLTCDLAPLGTEAAVAGLALNKKGRILSDVVVMPDGARLLAAVDGASAAGLRESLDHFLVMEDAEIALASEPMVWMLSIGPGSGRLVEAVRALDGGACAPLTYLGPPSAAFAFRASSGAGVVARACAAIDAPTDRLEPEDWDAVRIDLGVPRWRLDFDDATYPQEAGLEEHLVSFTKGCYLGQEVVVKMRSRGHPSRRLVRLLAPGHEAAPARGELVRRADGAEIGSVTSAARSVVVPDAAVAYAMLRHAEAVVGASVTVGGAAARVAPPFGLLAP